MSLDTLHDLTAFYHRHIDEVMLLHQEALLLQRLPLAGKLLKLFEELLLAHIEIEDGLVFPLFDEKVAQSRWPSLLYYKEHEKIVAMLVKITDQFHQLEALEGSALRRAVLSLLDYEKSFKGVLEHHTEREEQALLPELEKALDGEQIVTITLDAGNRWHDVREKQQQALESLRSELDQV